MEILKTESCLIQDDVRLAGGNELAFVGTVL